MKEAVSETTEFNLSGSSYWKTRAEGGYNKLGWVNNNSLLDRMVQIANLKGDEIALDAGSGSGAVLDALAPHLPNGKIFGFDISADMLSKRLNPTPANAELFVASIYEIPLPDNSVDLVTARQVYHNLEDIPSVVREAKRILKPGGRLIVSEYVPQDIEVLKFEQPIWDIKEPGRNLWTGEQLFEEIKGAWSGENGLSLAYGFIPDYSNRDWMESSGLPARSQQEILDAYLAAPDEVVAKTNMVKTPDGDTVMARPWAFVVAVK